MGVGFRESAGRGSRAYLRPYLFLDDRHAAASRSGAVSPRTFPVAGPSVVNSELCSKNVVSLWAVVSVGQESFQPSAQLLFRPHNGVDPVQYPREFVGNRGFAPSDRIAWVCQFHHSGAPFSRAPLILDDAVSCDGMPLPGVIIGRRTWGSLAAKAAWSPFMRLSRGRREPSPGPWVRVAILRHGCEAGVRKHDPEFGNAARRSQGAPCIDLEAVGCTIEPWSGQLKST